MLDKYTFSSGSAALFQEKSKKYNVNMTVIVRTLHKKDGCCHSNGMTKFIPFDTIEEVENFEKLHNVTFRRCANCFKQGRK